MFLPGLHPLHLTRPGRLQRRRGPVQALQRDLLPPGVPPGKPLRDPAPEPGPGILARSLHHRGAPAAANAVNASANTQPPP